MIWLGKQPAERHSCVGSPRGRSSMGFASENQGSYRTPRWRKGDSNLRSPLDASEPPTQLGLRSGGGSAYASSMRSRSTGGKSATGGLPVNREAVAARSARVADIVAIDKWADVDELASKIYTTVGGPEGTLAAR